MNKEKRIISSVTTFLGHVVQNGVTNRPVVHFLEIMAAERATIGMPRAISQKSCIPEGLLSMDPPCYNRATRRARQLQRGGHTKRVKRGERNCRPILHFLASFNLLCSV